VSDAQTDAFQLSKAIEAAKAMMSRRKIDFTAADQEIFETLSKQVD
jgi:hypothetical protein